MRAIVVTTLDGPESVSLQEAPAPADDSQVAIAVKAAGVSFPELLQTRGQYQLKPDLPFIPGAEVAGVVTAAPPDSGLAPGDRVAALPLIGGFAENVTTRPDLAFRLPDNVDFAAGASIIFNYGTVHFGLTARGRLSEGETVLVHGAAGGIGTAAIQVAKAFGAGRVIGVVSTDAKGAVAMDAGADEYVLTEDFSSFARNGRSSVDIVVDPVGGDRFTDSLRTLREDGRVLVIGFTAGSIPEVRVNRLLLNNIGVVGVGWGAYALGKPGFIQQQWNELLPHLSSGALAPILGPIFPLERAADALKLLDERGATGKITLSM